MPENIRKTVAGSYLSEAASSSDKTIDRIKQQVSVTPSEPKQLSKDDFQNRLKLGTPLNPAKDLEDMKARFAMGDYDSTNLDKLMKQSPHFSEFLQKFFDGRIETFNGVASSDNLKMQNDFLQRGM